MESGLTPARHSRASRILILAAALSMLIGLLAAAPPSTAHADAGSVTITPIGGTQFTAYKAKYRLAPSYKATGDVVVDSATVTVVKGTKTIAADWPVVGLGPGTYTVTQKVSYRPFTYQTRQDEVVSVGTWIELYPTAPYSPTCTLTSTTSTSADAGDWAGTCDVPGSGVSGTVKVEGTWELQDAYSHLFNSEGDEVYAFFDVPEIGSVFHPWAKLKSLSTLTKPVTEKVYGASATITQTQKLTVKAGRKNCATRTDYKKLKVSKRLGHGSSTKTVSKRLFSKGSRYFYDVVNGHTLEVRVYLACEPGYGVAVGFIDGHAYNKAYGN
ncbi:MAG: hypothetical protein LWW77_08875 [Propionibacteriales bacterium]|nr:hypothetical protein [Propionibacteriales bacterium]